MKHKIRIILLLLVFYACNIERAQAQRLNEYMLVNNMERLFKASSKLSIGAGGGISLINSDYGGSGSGLGDKIKGNGFGPNMGFGAAYQITPYIGTQGNVEYLSLKGGQNATTNAYLFDSRIISVSGSAVLYLISKEGLARSYVHDSGFQVIPYVRAGVGMLHYTSSSINEEGQSEANNSGWSAFAPFGGGLKLPFSSSISIAAEGILNATLSDLLDNKVASGGLTGEYDNIANFSVKVLYTPGNSTFNRSRRY